MSPILPVRKMIAGMYALYAIDFGIKLGLFEALAKSEHNLPVGKLFTILECHDDKELLMGLIRALEAVGVVHITKGKKIIFNAEWEDALTNTKSIHYLATLPECYIKPINDFHKFPYAIRHGRKLPWQSLSYSIIDAVSADAVRSANYFIEVVANKVSGLREKLIHGATVYDIGCAAGHSTLRLAEAFPNSRFNGIDVLPRAIVLAGKNLKKSSLKNVSFKKLCATKLTPRIADVIILNDVFHEMALHLRLPALIAIRDSLKKGGGMFFSDPLSPASDKDYKKNIFKNHLITSFFEVPYGAHVATSFEAKQLLKQAGFKNVSVIESSENELSLYAYGKQI